MTTRSLERNTASASDPFPEAAAFLTRSITLSDSLSKLLELPERERQSRGLVHTPGEIQQQPSTWRGTAKLLTQRRAQILGFLDECGPADRLNVLLTGAGTSDYIGRAVAALLRRQWQCEVTAVASTELLTNMEDYLLPGRNYLLISLSRSGDSSEGVALIQHALEQYPARIRHLVLTCNHAGAMAQQFAGHPGLISIVLDEAVNDRGLAMTSSFSNLVVAGQFLAYIRTPQKYAPLVESLARMGERLLPAAADLAATLSGERTDQVCFLGTGALEAVADESALKVLELNAGRIHTIAQSALGLRHGPLSSLDAATLVVAYLSGDEPRAQYEIDLLEELREKQLGSRMVIVTPAQDSRLTRLTQSVLLLEAPKDFPDACRPPVDVVVGQLLGLFFAIRNGLTPDSPSPSGAISRVVSHVKIYSRNGATA
jgi:tagatose-6-phosphate ketose/aldose isomerase